MPGGYIDCNKTLLDSAIKELREETGLKVPTKVLRGSIAGECTFDDPKRSTRGRIITHTFLFQLDDSQPLPKVKGGDDADDAMWVTLDDVVKMRSVFFEDHFSILTKMLNI